jgi:hypothetical protein
MVQYIYLTFLVRSKDTYDSIFGCVMWKTFSSVAEPDPGSGAFFTPEVGMRAGKIHIQDPRSGTRIRVNIPDLILENLLSVFWEMEKSDPGSPTLDSFSIYFT